MYRGAGLGNAADKQGQPARVPVGCQAGAAAEQGQGLDVPVRDATLKAKAGNALVDPDEVRIIPYYPLSIF